MVRGGKVPLVLVSFSLLAGALVAGRPPSARTTPPEPNPEPPSPMGAAAVVRFEPNLGQARPDVRFVARGRGITALVTAAGLEVPLVDPSGAEVLRLSFEGARGGSPEGFDLLQGVTHYLRGPDPSAWVTGIPAYGRVVVPGVVPGVDVVYRDRAGRLEFDLVLSPGVDPGAVVMTLQGHDRLWLDPSGDLVLEAGPGLLRQTRPEVWQESADGRTRVPGAFTILGPARVGFAIGAYDRSLPLVIDPVLVSSTYLGGGDDVPADIAFDNVHGVATDAAGNIYVAGETGSSLFPTTPGAFQRERLGDLDAFVVKFSPDGSVPLFSTFLGGTGGDRGHAVAVDAEGHAYVAGETASADFPVTPGAYQGAYGGGIADAFVAKLAPDGSALEYATYVGGEGTESGGYQVSLALGSDGAVSIGGATDGSFPRAGFLDLAGTRRDGFVARLDPTGSALVFAGTVGGSRDDWVRGVAVDAAGDLYVAGNTKSNDFPTTPGAFQGSRAGADDAFVLVVEADGGGLRYSTYLGGAGADFGTSVAAGADGSAYLTGSTDSTDFPVSADAFDPTLNGGIDPFVTRMRPDGARPLFSTYLGGSLSPPACFFESESGEGIGVAPDGSVHVAGYTTSENFPVTPDAISPVSHPCYDAWVSVLEPSGESLRWSTYLGGHGDDYGWALSVGSNGDTYVGGSVVSETFPTAGNPPQQAYTGPFYGDGFVAHLAPGSPLRGEVGDAGFVPRDRTAPIGGGVQWRFAEASAVPHSVTDGSGLGLFDSGPRAAGALFAFVFTGAGTYPVVDSLSSHRSLVRVPVEATPAWGDVGTEFTVRWASAPPGAGLAFDVAVRRPGAPGFVPWRTGDRGVSAAFVPDAGPGTYRFVARLRRTGGGARTEWSPAATIRVG